ncbi:hypothetical protein Hanom_Chr03g00199371 [Helianthus anomalus]
MQNKTKYQIAHHPQICISHHLLQTTVAQLIDHRTTDYLQTKKLKDPSSNHHTTVFKPPSHCHPIQSKTNYTPKWSSPTKYVNPTTSFKPQHHHLDHLPSLMCTTPDNHHH